jgi:LmbE family N-acetylglucosaminyl deacetylase
LDAGAVRLDLPESVREAKSVLGVSAHPDDAEFFAGAALARFAAQGARVTLVVCTDGGMGGRELDDAAGVRSREQEAAAKVLGIAEVVGLGLPDGALEPGEALREKLVGVIRRVRPELVLGHDPRTFFVTDGRTTQLGHSDHRAAGTGLLDAVYPRAVSPNFYPAAGKPWYPRELWLFDTAQADLRLDATAGFEKKLEALRAHASQEGVAGGLVDAARRLGRHFGSAERPAEGFARLPLW